MLYNMINNLLNLLSVSVMQYSAICNCLYLPKAKLLKQVCRVRPEEPEPETQIRFFLPEQEFDIPVPINPEPELQIPQNYFIQKVFI